MIEALKDKRTLMIGGGALVAILLLFFGYRALFSHSSEAEQAAADSQIKGAWVPSVIPDPPPVAFDPQKDWGNSAAQLTQITVAAHVKVKSGVRIERGKTPGFDDGLLVVDQTQVDRTLFDQPRILVRMSHHGDRAVDSARLDILFLDSKSTLLARRAVNPLVISGGLSGDKIKPLRPGEVREFFVDATQAPLGWMDQLSTEVVYYQFAP